jgi:hypothetical protein
VCSAHRASKLLESDSCISRHKGSVHLITAEMLTTALGIFCSLFLTSEWRMEQWEGWGGCNQEGGYGGKLEKQVGRISIAFTLWFDSPNNSFPVMRRRGLVCGLCASPGSCHWLRAADTAIFSPTIILIPANWTSLRLRFQPLLSFCINCTLALMD